MWALYNSYHYRRLRKLRRPDPLRRHRDDERDMCVEGRGFRRPVETDSASDDSIEGAVVQQYVRAGHGASPLSHLQVLARYKHLTDDLDTGVPPAAAAVGVEGRGGGRCRGHPPPPPHNVAAKPAGGGEPEIETEPRVPPRRRSLSEVRRPGATSAAAATARHAAAGPKAATAAHPVDDGEDGSVQAAAAAPASPADLAAAEPPADLRPPQAAVGPATMTAEGRERNELAEDESPVVRQYRFDRDETRRRTETIAERLWKLAEQRVLGRRQMTTSTKEDEIHHLYNRAEDAIFRRRKNEEPETSLPSYSPPHSPQLVRRMVPKDPIINAFAVPVDLLPGFRIAAISDDGGVDDDVEEIMDCDLEHLRNQERILLAEKWRTEWEEYRGPCNRWWEMRSNGFSTEAHKNKVKGALAAM